MSFHPNALYHEKSWRMPLAPQESPYACRLILPPTSSGKPDYGAWKQRGSTSVKNLITLVQGKQPVPQLSAFADVGGIKVSMSDCLENLRNAIRLEKVKLIQNELESFLDAEVELVSMVEWAESYGFPVPPELHREEYIEKVLDLGTVPLNIRSALKSVAAYETVSKLYPSLNQSQAIDFMIANRLTDLSSNSIERQIRMLRPNHKRGRPPKKTIKS